MLIVRHPAPHQEGRSGSSRVLGAGSDGRVGVRRRRTLTRTAKTCGPDLPTLGSSCSRDVSQAATVAIKPGHRGERAISRKPLRRECRHVRRTCHDLRACSLPFLHARLRVRFGIRHSLRPLDFGGTKMTQSSGISCREDADSHPLRCRAPRKRGIQYSRDFSIQALMPLDRSLRRRNAQRADPIRIS